MSNQSDDTVRKNEQRAVGFAYLTLNEVETENGAFINASMEMLS